MQTSASPMSFQKREVLVVFLDLINFGTFSNESSTEHIFSALDQFYRKVKNQVEKHQGRTIKFMHDGALVVFEKEQADTAIRAMLELKTEVDAWYSKLIPKGGLAVNCHVGEVTGPQGKQLEIIGDAVGITMTLGKRQFLISPQAFRSLNAETRKSFHKYTPPVVYRLTH